MSSFLSLFFGLDVIARDDHIHLAYASTMAMVVSTAFWLFRIVANII